MASRIPPKPPKPMAVIFLSTEGVFINSGDENMRNKIDRTCSEKFRDMQRHENLWKYEQEAYEKRSATYHFSKPALLHLMELIKKVKQVRIVIFSLVSKQKWDVDVLKNEVFIDTPFVRWVIGKTENHASQEDEVQEWLDKNECRWNVERFAIIGSSDPKNFPRLQSHYIHVQKETFLTKDDTDQAYEILTGNKAPTERTNETGNASPEETYGAECPISWRFL